MADQSTDANNSLTEGNTSLINSSKLEDESRKLFVGGLSWETTADDLTKYFNQFGEVLETTVKQDSITKRSRGFGFVLFSSTEAVSAVSATKLHDLNGRKIDPKPALANGGKEPNTKLFLGGLDPSVTEQELQAWFDQNQCKVVKIEWPVDKAGTGAKKGFCFVTVGSIREMKRMCGRHEIGSNNKTVEVKEAVPKDDIMRGGGRGGGMGSYRGGPTSRGGRGGSSSYSGYGGYSSTGYDSTGYGYGVSSGYGQGYDQSYGGDYYNSGYGSYGDGYSGYGPSAYGTGYEGYSNGSGYGGYGAAGSGDYKAKSARGGATSYHPYSR